MNVINVRLLLLVRIYGKQLLQALQRGREALGAADFKSLEASTLRERSAHRSKLGLTAFLSLATGMALLASPAPEQARLSAATAVAAGEANGGSCMR